MSTRLTLALLFCLFFLWGLASNLVNALNEPFKSALELTSAQTSALQVAHYLSYFFIAVPAAYIARRFGYKAGITTGLAIFTAGALATIPAVNWLSYPAFLVSIVIMAAGMATIETNASPYVAKLGSPATESLRLNTAQSFNGIGSVIGPLLASAALGGVAAGSAASSTAAVMDAIGGVYVALAVIIAIVLGIFLLARLPEPASGPPQKPSPPQKPDLPQEPNPPASSAQLKMAEPDAPAPPDQFSSPQFSVLWKIPHLSWGVLAAFLYVGAQVTVMSQLASYAAIETGLASSQAAQTLALGTLMFAIGRIVTTPLMSRYDPGKILTVYMTGATILLVFSALTTGETAVLAAILSLFFMSVGYPTIYALGLQGLRGDAAKNGAALLTMALVGGAFWPLVFSFVADWTSLSVSFAGSGLILTFVAWYGIHGSRPGA